MLAENTHELEAATITRVTAMWAGLAGIDGFARARPSHCVNAESQICPRTWSGVVAIDGALVATAASERERPLLLRLLQELSTDDSWGPICHKDSAVAEILGPASLAYVDCRAFIANDAPPNVTIREPINDEVEVLARSVPIDDVEESGIVACTTTLVCVNDGVVLAASGFREWPGDIVHMSVLVATSARGRGLGTFVASAATRTALDAGMIPQWRARPPASRAIAAKLGYAQLGQQVSVRFATTG